MTNQSDEDPMDQTDAEPLKRLCEGDQHALAELFSIHQKRLRHIINLKIDSRLAGRLDAEDVMQEIFMDASSRIDHFVNLHPGSFFVWLRLIATQSLTNIHRRHLAAEMRDADRDVSINRGTYRHPGSDSFAIQLMGKITSPSRAAIRAEDVEALRQAIDKMDTKDREILQLRHFEQLTNKETAEVLGIQIKAASIRYIRSLQKLRKVLVQVPGFVDEDGNH